MPKGINKDATVVTQGLSIEAPMPKSEATVTQAGIIITMAAGIEVVGMVGELKPLFYLTEF